MTTPDEELGTLRRLSPNAELWTEGGVYHAFLPGVRFGVHGGENVIRDLLLRPSASPEGYTTRLYLSAQIAAPNAKNWTAAMVGGRNWYVCSWNNVPADIPWIEMVAGHFRAFQ